MTEDKRMNGGRIRWGIALAIGFVVWIGTIELGGRSLPGSGDAMAVIGRPLTPISYAGVARRTVRRSVYY
jgi:hypothetical protein